MTDALMRERMILSPHKIGRAGPDPAALPMYVRR